MPANFCTITQKIEDPLQNPQVDKPIIIEPLSSPLFINPNNDGTTWIEILNMNVTTTTDHTTGTVTVNLPYPAICYPNTVHWQWTTPDGFVFAGLVPSVAGPLTLKDLVVTYSWTHTP